MTMKAIMLAAALLAPVAAFAQGTATPSAAPARPAKPVHAAPHPAKPPQTSPEVLDIVQIIGIRQVDAATYEIDARLQNGHELHLRANAFVMQSLGQMLGTYGK
jgi:hypothetical protein